MTDSDSEGRLDDDEKRDELVFVGVKVVSFDDELTTKGWMPLPMTSLSLTAICSAAG